MTWTCTGFAGGEVDTLGDGWVDSYTRTMFGHAGDNCTRVTSPVHTGAGAIKVGTGAAQGNSDNASASLGNQLFCAQGWMCLGNAPAAEWIVLDASGGAAYDRFVLYGNTSGQLQLRYKLAGGAETVYSPWSPVGLATDGATLKHVAWVSDPFTAASGGSINLCTFQCLFISSQLQWAVPTPQAAAIATTAIKLISPSDAALYVDDYWVLTSTTPGDAPHLTPLPIGKVLAQHPVGAGLNAGFSLYPNSGEAAWQDWDDVGANDGDSTYLYDPLGAVSKLQDSAMQSRAATGMAAGATILHKPVLTVIDRYSAGSKFNGDSLCNLAGPLALPAPAATYAVHGVSLVRSSGVWTPDDLDSIIAGVQTMASGQNETWQVTEMLLQWVCSEATLPLTPPPVLMDGQLF
jgi:hypothetical protein